MKSIKRCETQEVSKFALFSFGCCCYVCVCIYIYEMFLISIIRLISLLSVDDGKMLRLMENVEISWKIVEIDGKQLKWKKNCLKGKFLSMPEYFDQNWTE